MSEVEHTVEPATIEATIKVVQQCDKPIVLVFETPPQFMATKFQEIQHHIGMLIHAVKDATGHQLQALVVPHGFRVTAVEVEKELLKHVHRDESHHEVGSPEQVA